MEQKIKDALNTIETATGYRWTFDVETGNLWLKFDFDSKINYTHTHI